MKQYNKKMQNAKFKMQNDNWKWKMEKYKIYL